MVEFWAETLCVKLFDERETKARVDDEAIANISNDENKTFIMSASYFFCERRAMFVVETQAKRSFKIDD